MFSSNQPKEFHWEFFSPTREKKLVDFERSTKVHKFMNDLFFTIAVQNKIINVIFVY